MKSNGEIFNFNLEKKERASSQPSLSTRAKDREQDYLSRSLRIGDEVRLDVPVLLRRGFFFNFAQLEEGREVEGRHGSAPSKIIPWSVSWHPIR